MPRTREQLKKALTDAEAWLERLDPKELASPDSDATDLRAIGEAMRTVAASDLSLAEQVAKARANGRTWTQIAAVLGVTKQAARERFGEPVNCERLSFFGAPDDRGDVSRTALRGLEESVPASTTNRPEQPQLCPVDAKRSGGQVFKKDVVDRAVRDYVESHRDEINAGVRAALLQLDGTNTTAVSIMTGLSAERLDELGGVPED